MVMILGSNLPDNIIARLGFDSDYFLVALVAWVITALIAHRESTLIVLVVFMAIGANLPLETAEHLNLNRDILFAGLVAIIVIPFIARHIE